ncbi:MAG: hypothetical protein RL032_1048 [Pseudomonadota bacterium]|jgi:hypothetical protein
MTQPPRIAQWLGYGGLLPFVGLAGAALGLGPLESTRITAALLAYGASILSFMGAIHWGLAMGGGAAPDSKLLLWGVVPSLVAWVALLLGTATGLWLVVLGLWACFAVDRTVYPRFGLRSWLPMRLVLTLVATLACALTAWSLRA